MPHQQRICHHILASGVLCKAEPLRNRNYCRFHLDQIGRRMRAARARARHQPSRLRLPLLEDQFSVQVALMQVADALACQTMDPQYARLLITVLRLAMTNLKSRQAWEFADEQEDAVTEWETFEQEHDLPAGLDLSLDPEVAFPPPEPEPEVDDPVRAKVRRALGDTEALVSPVTADQVELMEIYHNEGEEAATKFADQLVRNDRRRERQRQRARYQEMARNHSINSAAHKLFEDAVQAGILKPGMTPTESWQAIKGKDGEALRKPPLSEFAEAQPEAAVVGV